MTTTLALSVTINSYQTVEEVPDLDLEIVRMACWQFVRPELTNILIRALIELLLRGFEKRERNGHLPLMIIMVVISPASSSETSSMFTATFVFFRRFVVSTREYTYQPTDGSTSYSDDKSYRE